MPDTQRSAQPMLGYCTNVHAGVSLAETQRNLATYACEVQRRLSWSGPLGIGLWLSHLAARELLEGEALLRFRDWLSEHELHVFTINGFPYGDFHQKSVKQDVYEPDWREPARLHYTNNLIDILAALTPENSEGSISTLPVGWRAWISGPSDAQQAADNLLRAVEHMQHVHSETGRLIHLDLEPEPGCYLQRSRDVVEFIQTYVLVKDDAARMLAHLRVCHDICHAAVMFEDQESMFAAYKGAGIRVGKVQVSSAVRADFVSSASEDHDAMLRQLAGFAEDRYLHQTMVYDGSEAAFFEDLPAALPANLQGTVPHGEWRVHFHVPIYLERFGHLQSTQFEIDRCFALLRDMPEVQHYEVETYAWNVLPADMRADSLAEGIAREMHWLRQRMDDNERT